MLQYPDAEDSSTGAAGWQHLIMQQQQQQELEGLRQRASREQDRQVLADVWQQQHLYDDSGQLARADGYNGQGDLQGLPTTALADEEEAQQESAGDTFMVMLKCSSVDYQL